VIEWEWVSIAIMLLAVPGGIVSAALWFACGDRRLFPAQPLPDVRWTGPEVLLCLLLLFLMPGAALGLLQALGFFEHFYGKTPSNDQQGLWTMGLGLLLVLTVLFPLIYSVSQTKPRDLGWTAGRWRQNVVIGYIGWVLLTPLVFLVNDLATKLTEPEVHAVEKAARAGLWPAEWVVLVLQAVVLAAAVEEILFRGVLLRWLLRAGPLEHGLVAAGGCGLAVVFRLRRPAPGVFELDLGPLLFALALLPGYFALVWWGRHPRLPSLPGRQGDLSDGSQAGTPSSLATGVASTSTADENRISQPASTFAEGRSPLSVLAALYGSSMLFAIFHASVWPTPIALFVLGLGLGWLAYRTQSLVGPMVMHGLFNAVSCLTLALKH
jgi:membrane protease YdiL (CAAX protease family)